MNDFGFPLKPPNHPRYLNTEFVGHTFPTKTIDNVERLTEHTLRHARIHDQLASNPQYAGGIGWCAFDYNTRGDFGSGDHICYHGVSDIFREPKPAAGFYKSQCDPAEQVVLEPAFHWARGDESVGFSRAVVSSNCDHLKFYIDDKLVAEADPDRAQFAHLRYPPFDVKLGELFHRWGDLRIEGYIGGKQVIAKSLTIAPSLRKTCASGWRERIALTRLTWAETNPSRSGRGPVARLRSFVPRETKTTSGA
jgi:beta-galactosidase